MRFIASILILLVLLVPPPCRAQDSPSRIGDRLILNLGVGETYSVIAHNWLDGFHFRADYQVTAPDRLFGLRVHAGGFWTPNQSSSVPVLAPGSAGTTFESRAQSIGLDFGVSAAMVPWPRGTISPYALVGIARRQQWSYGSGYYRAGDGTATELIPASRLSGGTYAAFTGVGVQLRFGGRLMQFESRRSGHQKQLGVGTSLRF
jgi:hypothetical protein